MRRPSCDSKDASSPSDRSSEARPRTRSSRAPDRLAGARLEQPELRRVGRSAEGKSETPALLVVVEAVQHPVRQLSSTDEDPLDRELPRTLVEAGVIDPRAPVDVVPRRVARALEVLDALELTRALVRGALDRHRLDLPEAFERDVCRTAGVLEDGRGDEHAGTARRGMHRPEAGQRVVATRFPLVERCPEQHLAIRPFASSSYNTMSPIV